MVAVRGGRAPSSGTVCIWILRVKRDTLLTVRRPLTLALVLLGLAACENSPNGQSPGWGTSITTNPSAPSSSSSSSGPGEESSNSGTSSTSTSSSTGSDTTVAPPPDMPNFDTLEPVPEGCEKIDVLFALNHVGGGVQSTLDDSRELAESEAERLLGLVGALTAEAQNYDLQVMVTSSTDQFYNTADDWCYSECMGVSGVPDPACELIPELACAVSDDECDNAHGAGSIYPRGLGASNKLCPTTEGRRYARSQDPQFSEALDCLLRAGRSDTGNFNYPAITPMVALKPEMVAEGGCNAGFLRDDAMLVVVLVSSKDESTSPGTPAKWVEDLLALKNNYADSVVFVALTEGVGGDPCGDYPTRIRAFAEMMPNSVLGCRSTGDFTPLVTAAITKIDEVCDRFVPPG